jgi:hypothetical protein
MTTSMDRRSGRFGLGWILARSRYVSCIHHNLLYCYVCMDYEAWIERLLVL